MADPPRNRDFREKADGDTGIPRWVKVSGIIVIILVLLVVVMLLVGGGGHRPRRHGGAGVDAPPFMVTQDAPFGLTGD